jgi:hypothetical protein
MTERQQTFADDGIWDDLKALDDARLKWYSRTGVYRSLTGTAVAARAARYLSKCEPAISGAGGRARLWHTVMTIVHGFDLSAEEAYVLLRPWNAMNQPPFSEHEIQTTCWRAHRKPGPRGDKLR